MAVAKIETFIFLDIEASGFAANNEIAEMAFLAVHREAMDQAAGSINHQLPRVVDKLVLCVDPGEEIAYKENQLSQALLQESGKAVFDEKIGKLIAQFFERQAQPACLIAHNGSGYDFILLAKKIASIGVTIPDIRCGDSLQAFRNTERGKPRGGYRLPNLYRSAFGRSQDNSHNAESDVVALMKLVVKAGPKIRMWFDKNSNEKLLAYKFKPFPQLG
ncbi:three-prime repair exonuclease 1-like [Amphiura filiformis]|uniref:three-prime repair exonuclease 1-like n=1 Tax=Amphiura filiformis TaxID=82378 RepID=UPI003B21D422